MLIDHCILPEYHLQEGSLYNFLLFFGGGGGGGIGKAKIETNKKENKRFVRTNVNEMSTCPMVNALILLKQRKRKFSKVKNGG